MEITLEPDNYYSHGITVCSRDVWTWNLNECSVIESVAQCAIWKEVFCLQCFACVWKVSTLYSLCLHTAASHKCKAYVAYCTMLIIHWDYAVALLQCHASVPSSAVEATTTHDARKGEPVMPIKSAFFASRRTRSRKQNGYVEFHRSCCRRTSRTTWLSVRDILTLVSSYGITLIVMRMAASLPVPRDASNLDIDAVPTIFPNTPWSYHRTCRRLCHPRERHPTAYVHTYTYTHIKDFIIIGW